MKKFLLSLAAGVLCAGSALADANVVLAEIGPFKDYTTTTNLTEANNNLSFGGGDFTFTVAKNGGSNDPSYNTSGKDLRIYAKGTFTVTATNAMTQIVFNISTQGKKRLTDITASEGTIATQAEGDETVTWTGNATTVTFTVGEKATYGSDGASKAGQFDFTSFDITGGGTLSGGSVTPDPGIEPAGAGTEADPYNVAKAIDLIQSGAVEDEDVYVKGKIASVKEVSTSYGNATYGISDDGTVAKQLTVFRGLYINGEKFTSADQLPVGADVVVKGKLVDYNGTPEMAQGNQIVSITGGTVTPPPTGKGTKDDPYLCSELIALGADASENGVWLKAYIVGNVPGQKLEEAIFGVEGVTATNILVGPSADCTTVSECVPVQLPSGSIRSALNLADNPGNYGKEVLLNGDIAKYFSAPGFKNTKDYEILGGGVTPPPAEGVDFVIANSITSGSDYVMVVDGQIATAISQTATYGRLNLTNIAITDGKLNTQLTNAITITAEGTGYTMKDSYGRYLGFDGEHTTSFQLYDAVEAACIWDIAFTNGEALITLTINEVTGTVGVTKGNNDTWYTNVAPSVGATEIKLPTLYARVMSSVENITVADENAPVEYFNLQGVRVENPANGLYIRRQGNTVSKIYIR